MRIDGDACGGNGAGNINVYVLVGFEPIQSGSFTLYSFIEIPTAK